MNGTLIGQSGPGSNVSEWEIELHYQMQLSVIPRAYPHLSMQMIQYNINFKQIYLTHQCDPNQVQPLYVRVDLGVMRS